MRTNLTLYTLACLMLISFSLKVYSQAANNTCASATTLTPAATCSVVTGNLQKATSASTDVASSGSCGGATAATTFDVWYKFTAISSATTITVNNLGSNLTGGFIPYLEVLNGTCGSFTSVSCQSIGTGLTTTITGLTAGNTYYIRVYTTTQGTANPSSKWNFDICLTSSVNDDCSRSVSLTSGTSCTNTAGTLDLTTATTGLPVGCESAGTHYDAWYSFVATKTTHFITISGLTNISNPEIQLYGGSCGALTSVQCGTTTLTGSGLTIGATYYIRVSNIGSSPTNSSFNICVTHPPANDDCSGAISLTPSTTCSNTVGTLNYSTPSTGVPAGCFAAGTHYDTWYSFVAAGIAETVTLSSITNISNPEIQVYSGSCGSLTSLSCGSTSLTVTGLTAGNTYYVRVSNLGSMPSNSSFSICIATPPSNDECANAITLYSNTTCSNTSGTLASATASAGIPLGCAPAGTYYDVWYTFTAANASQTIALSSAASVSNPAIQLYSGSCGSLTSIACVSGTTLNATGLSAGTTYYVRVSSTASASGTFNICITHPAPVVSSIDYGKSYVNISKNSGGGTINPGDTLEIRATLVIKSGSGLDSLAFLDTLHLGGGVTLVPGSITLRTNEGKVYKSFTDAIGDDAGYYYTSGTDTVVRINFGANASATTRGKLLNTSKPSVFGSTCIIMATYRVVVYAGYGTTLNLGGGKITSKDVATGTLSDLSFSSRNAVVYSSPGLCPNAVAASNAIGGDYNGTFGTGTAQNRGPSGNVLGYTYATFTTGAPQDYYYGIANNTSAGGTSLTTTTTWAKPDNSSPTHRVFNVWDISGDHTGATNTSKGNPPCDPSKPVSASNPCGYMLVVNSAYKTDTAFQFAVTNLCPNTYYEISAWLKNICYKCGCDSNGIGVSGTGYIPSGTNDSSGIQPNLTFDINGTDYYTTGNIAYGGLYPSTQAGSDSNNTWVKRGFTYLTGSSQTSLKLTIRNNAPGGGGNDWAMDDISLATCLPNMRYSPSLSPTTCNNNVLAINDTIQSYFSNYQYYKWQRSTDGGSTWSDIASATGTASPAWNGSAYQYITSYTIPTTATYVANNGDKYRVVVGTTSSSLSNSNCQVTDGVSQISLNVIDCNNPPPLATYILSFSGTNENGHARLFWSTNHEDEPIHFEIEKSKDGNSFSKIGTVAGYQSTDPVNYYNFVDSSLLLKNFYRVSLVNNDGKKKYSRVIQLKNSIDEFSVTNLTNYFESAVLFDVSTTKDSKIDVSILNASGNLIKQQSFTVYNGANNIVIQNLNSLTPGLYILQVRNKEQFVNEKIIKK